ncbi:MAG: hypothetical protein DRP06_04585 [Candidatus Aenigmatarchaeota archaeon]|nr:MAG: hypothetical protein DRP06_04585 [Candidatus Aenigmarchaeota archaeon]
MDANIKIYGMMAAILSVMLVFGTPMLVKNTQSFSDSPTWIATVCPTIERADGSIEKLECTHNLLVDQGKNFTAEVISGLDFTSATPGTDFAKHISLSSDSSSPSASWKVLPSEITSNGLDRHTGTCAINGVGNFSCWYQFEATGTQSGIHLAGLNWNATDGANSLVAANALSSDVNLESGDKLTIFVFKNKYEGHKLDCLHKLESVTATEYREM